MNTQYLTKMIKPTHIYDEALRRSKELIKIQQEKEKALQKAPKGKLHIVKSRRSTQFYLRVDKSDKSGKYIKRSEVEKIKRYVQKTYDEKVLKLLETEIKALEVYLRKSKSIDNRIKRLYSANPDDVKTLITPIDIADDDYIAIWDKEKYEGKTIPKNIPVYETKGGERVRSKSELNIANALYDREIPYKYECPYMLANGKVIYPDFTVLKVSERKVIYWEHRGMMDDREYARNAVNRIKSYNKNGVFLGENLILTEETSTDPLGTDEIETVISRLLC